MQAPNVTSRMVWKDRHWYVQLTSEQDGVVTMIETTLDHWVNLKAVRYAHELLSEDPPAGPLSDVTY